MKRKAIALLSGGLDSQLAARLVKDQGIEVVGLHLLSPFGCREDVQKVADAIGIKVLFREKGEAYLDLVEKPKYGYGKAVNPCIDCRIFMFEKAEEVRLEENADFIVTGEVLGQRPMSQQRHAIDLIDKKSEAADRILRPLSAKLFPPTLPEREGWINREALCEIAGRSRRTQLDLADSLKLEGYSAPGGGCLLTETSFEPRLKDFFAHTHFQTSQEKLAQSELLRFGRHYRLSEQAKAIISRNSDENDALASRWKKAGGSFLFPQHFNGPFAILLGEATQENLRQVGRIIRRFSKAKEEPTKEIGFESTTTSGAITVGAPFEDSQLEAMRL